ncbi:MAG: 3-deoxy-manno-octulosonate cytidylyltransferase (CMP-KDO synthetase) [Maribacter sp.]|jgi:3-deoxy-manno-octulosonate cytidylyltransferase (CMP-KDO synthetase)
MTDIKVLAVIPARFASTRFHGKPLVEIRGKSMIQRVYESCIQSEMLEKVIVATDDERIFNHLKQHAADVEMTDSNHKNGTERIAEIARKFIDFDLVINVQGDEPCIHPEQINELVSLMKNNPSFEIGTLAKPISDKAIFKNKNAVKVYLSEKENKAMSFFRLGEFVENEAIGKHVGIYAFRRKTLLKLVELIPTENEKELSLEQLRWMDNDYKIAITWTNYESPSVDVPEDLEKVKIHMDKHNLS